jgi:hypothetical protein
VRVLDVVEVEDLVAVEDRDARRLAGVRDQRREHRSRPVDQRRPAVGRAGEVHDGGPDPVARRVAGANHRGD